ncbi:MAG: MBL fold metallo-hydrolase, partial [Oscillospiraceae bacterium]|nr:MBL fold metallo-hydrolase [Oscillospiraceae bacterium]
DHGGGLETFLEINTHAPVYLSEYAFEEHYNGERYIGLDSSLAQNPRLRFVKDSINLSDCISLFHNNDKPLVRDIDSGGLSAVIDGRKSDEAFRHEMYMLVKEQGKTILISGCSHKGIINIESWFEPDVLVGGFHLSKYPLDDTLADIARTLSQHKTSFITCHCTGTQQYEFMKKYIPSLDYISCGKVIEL